MFILLVEDNQFYAALVLERLKMEGFDNIKHVDNGLECLLQVYEETVPDVIIMDQELGLVNGVEVMQKVRAYKPWLKVIFLSTQEDVKIAVQSIKQGAMDYVKKDENSFNILIPLLKRIEEELKQKANSSPIKTFLGKIKRLFLEGD
jgi:DNA-binding NtrC family response regulator